MAWTVYKASGCCGLIELYGINSHRSTIEGGLSKLADRLKDSHKIDWSVAILIDRLSGDYPNTKSRKLLQWQKYIRRHKLGQLRISKPCLNPNSANTLITGTWSVSSYQAVTKHLKDLRKKQIARERDKVRFIPPVRVR